MGSLRRTGDRVRVSTELIEAATGRRVWSEVYDAEITNTFGVQEDISRRVVGGGSFRARRWRAFAMQSEHYIADRPRR